MRTQRLAMLAIGTSMLAMPATARQVPPPAPDAPARVHVAPGVQPGRSVRQRGPRWGGTVAGRWYGGTYAPGGWAAYRRPVAGAVIPRYWLAPAFAVGDYAVYRLAPPPAGHRWIRYYDDAVLVDEAGRVRQAASAVAWDSGDDRRYLSPVEQASARYPTQNASPAVPGAGAAASAAPPNAAGSVRNDPAGTTSAPVAARADEVARAGAAYPVPPVVAGTGVDPARVTGARLSAPAPVAAQAGNGARAGASHSAPPVVAGVGVDPAGATSAPPAARAPVRARMGEAARAGASYPPPPVVAGVGGDHVQATRVAPAAPAPVVAGTDEAAGAAAPYPLPAVVDGGRGRAAGAIPARAAPAAARGGVATAGAPFAAPPIDGIGRAQPADTATSRAGRVVADARGGAAYPPASSPTASVPPRSTSPAAVSAAVGADGAHRPNPGDRAETQGVPARGVSPRPRLAGSAGATGPAPVQDAFRGRAGEYPANMPAASASEVHGSGASAQAAQGTQVRAEGRRALAPGRNRGHVGRGGDIALDDEVSRHASADAAMPPEPPYIFDDEPPVAPDYPVDWADVPVAPDYPDAIEAPAVRFAAPMEQVQPLRPRHGHGCRGRCDARAADVVVETGHHAPVVVHSGNVTTSHRYVGPAEGYVAGGYWYPPASVTTVTVSAPATMTTTTVTEEVVTRDRRPRRAR